jgi:hypothetical protein
VSDAHCEDADTPASDGQGASVVKCDPHLLRRGTSHADLTAASSVARSHVPARKRTQQRARSI